MDSDGPGAHGTAAAAACIVGEETNAAARVRSTARENVACVLLRLAHLDGATTAAAGRTGAVLLLVSLLEAGGARRKKDAATTLCGGARENRQHAVEAGVAGRRWREGEKGAARREAAPGEGAEGKRWARSRDAARRRGWKEMHCGRDWRAGSEVGTDGRVGGAVVKKN